MVLGRRRPLDKLITFRRELLTRFFLDRGALRQSLEKEERSPGNPGKPGGVRLASLSRQFAPSGLDLCQWWLWGGEAIERLKLGGVCEETFDDLSKKIPVFTSIN